jgi:orotidine-5'-phosphate decarboxylase
MELLHAKWSEGKFVCVGLDSDAAKLPLDSLNLPNVERAKLAQQHFIQIQQYLAKPPQEREPGEEPEPLARWEEEVLAHAQLVFNKRIVDATKDIACAYKLNSAFYEALGSAGMGVLRTTIKYVLMRAPSVPVILDYKATSTTPTSAT